MTPEETARTQALRTQVQQALQHYFAIAFEAPQHSAVAAAAAYSLLGGGKRVRGVLAMAACELVCGSAAPAEPYAAALEMLHAYSLIHDDLPCMDDDDMRRGQPSCHCAFGEATALLAGDALLTAAFETLCAGPDAACRQAVRLLAQAAGPRGMVLGQELDLAAEKAPVDEAGLMRIHHNKTGRLLRAAAALGGLAGGADEGALAALDEYAAALGLAFQIVDDVLDVEAEPSQLGKPVGSDAQRGKTTSVTLLGAQGARARAQALTQRACAALQGRFGDASALLCAQAQALACRIR